MMHLSDVNFSPNSICRNSLLVVFRRKFAHFSKIWTLCDFVALAGNFAMVALRHSGPLPLGGLSLKYVTRDVTPYSLMYFAISSKYIKFMRLRYSFLCILSLHVC